jgi:hypothetical protein
VNFISFVGSLGTSVGSSCLPHRECGTYREPMSSLNWTDTVPLCASLNFAVVFRTGSAAHRGNQCLPFIGPIQFLYVPHSTFSAAHREEFILVTLNFDPKQTVT